MWYLLFSSAPISIWGVQELDTFKNSQISYLHPEVKIRIAFRESLREAGR